MEKKDRRTGLDRRSVTDTAPEKETETEVETDTRKRERRMGDRRDSPRIAIKLLVRQVDLGGSFEERDGDIGIGGVYYEDRFLPAGRHVELRFRLPGIENEIRCMGEILRISESPGRFGAHVRFVDMPTATELAIARFLDDKQLEGS